MLLVDRITRAVEATAADEDEAEDETVNVTPIQSKPMATPTANAPRI
jgi:hypothetical protein